ncbi:mg chelatase [Thalassiosira pseudonana CCMP1335]|uniref:Mg-protoporphyrin IX chelatase n=1 Tax=Thalassiosira pseudonana TaxID=35128 RepID=B8C9C8_THAPS|nr:mg chelatase [Thalassiosira pseudonana CCMP1335]EED90026.1 mg chelatase [Thalassiosira pseudonana CCMP1335]
MIIDQQEIKHALLLSAVNPQSVGVLISGGRGTAKSVLARSMQQIVPSHIHRIKGNEYNVDPKGRHGIDSFLLEQINENDDMSLESLQTELVPTPFVQIPLGVLEDSLIGTVDLEQSLETGEAKFSPGLLAKAHRGILYVDEINLLDDEVADILIKVLSDGYVNVEREGLSVKYPCRPLMIATFNPQEGEMREHLLDRFAIALSADAIPLSIQERVMVVDNVINFSGGLQEQASVEAEKRLRQAEVDEQNLRTQVELARLQLPKVNITRAQIQYLCEEATRGGCEGQRAEVFATEIAKASAALDGRDDVNSKDLQAAVILAILPRTLSKETPPPPSEGEPIPDSDSDTDKETKEETQDEISTEDSEDKEVQEDQPLAIPEEFMFGVKSVHIDSALLKFSRWTRKGRGGKRAKIFSLLRGRFVKAIFPKGKKARLAVGATLRAAAPFQKARRERAVGTKYEGRKVIIRKEDFRIKRMSRKAGTLVIFLVDASGSMALNRMNAAKGAAISLLSEAYKSRDKISLIAFHGEQAEVLVPPTRSIALTKHRLEAMPCGGGSPLAHGLTLAVRTGLNTMKVKQDVGRVCIVCITDGRANIPLELSLDNKFTPSTDPDSTEGMPSRKFLKDEVLACSRKLSSLADFDFVCIDTEDVFVRTGIAKEMAQVAQGKYHHLDSADSAAVTQITQQKLREVN